MSGEPDALPSAVSTTFVPKLWTGLLNSIFPPRCAGCGIWSSEAFCALCRSLLKPIKTPHCGVVGTPFAPLSLAVQECAGGAAHYTYYACDWPTMEYHLGERSLAGVFPTNNGEACVWV